MIIISGYEILEKLSETLKTVTYRASESQFQENVTIKVFRNDYPTSQDIANFRQEYEIAKNLNLEGVVKPSKLEKCNNGLALVLEDFGGKSLKTYTPYSKITLINFLKISIKIAEIIGTLHDKNIIHKNIQPQNIIINPETGKVKITDFSIASRLSRENPIISNPNFLEGTLAYMSPEQTGRMNRVIDYRTDFYSLGVTFYEMLIGQLPFQSTDPMELVHCHIAQQPISPYELNPEIPKTISDIVMKLLTKTAEDRYQSAYGLKADLEACLIQWQKVGKIENIILGQHDVSPKFQIPQKLYGREQEIITLMAAFDRVSQGTTEIVLVSGYSGIGKSALVNEIHKPIARQRGYFISGKFDQFQRNIPYASLIQAFQQLIRHLLTESQEKIEIWKEKLLNAFGTNGQVIIDVIPEVELIVGVQPPVPQLGLAESQNRLNLVFQKFLGVFTKIEHPLVLFLDDLQWADLASLKLLHLLVTSPDSRHLLVIGAYRDNEVSAAHPLMLTLDDVRSSGVPMDMINLQALGVAEVNQLIAETIHWEQARVTPLAELVFNKTAGNPFFLTQLLTSLYQEKLLLYNIEIGRWQWDIEQIKGVEITDNVVDLMINNIQKLSENTQNVLKLAACIGNIFDLKTLAIVNQKSLSTTATELWEALQEGLILPQSDAYKIPLIFEPETTVSLRDDDLKVSYKFLHDRVQQAAYFLISDKDQKEVHLKIGRLMLKNANAEQREEKIFDIVNQINFSVELITDPDEKYELAQLNLTAGQKAKSSTAYETALKYFVLGGEALPENIWNDHYKLAFSLHKERCQCEYFMGNFGQSEALLNILFANVKTELEKSELYNLKVVLYTFQTKVYDALQVGLEGLKMLGLDVPDTEDELQKATLTELEEVQLKLNNVGLEDLIDTPPMRDFTKQSIIKLLFCLGLPAYQINKNLMAFNTLKMLNLSLEYGFTDETPDAFCNYALIVGSVLGDYKNAYKFGQFALKLNEKVNNYQLNSKMNLWYGIAILPYKEHLKSSPLFLRQGYQHGLELGDLAHSLLNCLWLIMAELVLGNNLDQVHKQSEKYDHVVQSNPIYQDVYELLKRVPLNLQSLTESKYSLSDAKFNEEEFLKRTQKLDFKQVSLQFYYQFKLQVFWIFGNYTDAFDVAVKSDENVESLKATFSEVEHYFYYSLTLTALYPTASSVKQEVYWQTLERNQEKIKKWADNCPENFLHKYLLIAAELGRISGNGLEAMELYDQAIQSAKENEYTQNEAIANELAAKFYLSKGKDKFAQLYLREARYCYGKWGASAKVKDLDEKYPELLASVSVETQIGIGNNTVNSATSSTSSETGGNLDLTTIVKASQALSSEIVLGNLLGVLMKILIQNAGAQKGILILKKLGKLVIEAEKTVSDDKVFVSQSIPVEASPHLPVTLINYVERTQKNIVLNDAGSLGIFTTDPYVIENKPKSILCTPIIHQGKLTGILYLENNLTTSAFTPDRLEVLRLLSSQAAISIENALLYTNLEETTESLKISKAQLEDYSRTLELKVDERTLELQEKNECLKEQATQLKKTLKELKQTQTQLIQTEKMSSLGQLVAGVAHEINNPVNFIYGNLNYASEYIQDMLRLIHLYQEEYPNPTPRILSEIDAIDLEFLDEDLLKLLSSMKLGANRICQIVLSLRNFSRLDEAEMKPVDIHEGIDSTLLILQNRLKAKPDSLGIQVIKEYGNLPQVECYAGQLNQVFMNILTNAIDALEELLLRGQWSLVSRKITNDQQIKTDTPTISIRTNVINSDLIRVCICDNANGMTEKVRSRVFDPFFTTKPIGSGTGLGLSISYQIVVEKHGGQLQCISELGRGTELVIEIPVKPQSVKK